MGFRNARDRLRRAVTTPHMRKRRSANPQDQQSAAQSELTSVKFLAAVLAVYVYFTGWMYAFYLFRHFGISLNAVEIPLQTYYVYAYTVFATLWGLGVLTVAIVLGYALAVTGWGKWFAVPLLLLFIHVCAVLAWNQAQTHAFAIRRGADSKPIYLTLDVKVDPLPQDFARANSRGALRLLARSKSDYYLLWQPAPTKDDPEWPAAQVFHLKGDDVFLSMIRLREIPKEENER